MEQEQMMIKKVTRAREEFARLQQAAEEALWEDVDEEPVVMEGEKVEMSDVHNMLHFAKVINLMDDTTSNKLDRVSN